MLYLDGRWLRWMPEDMSSMKDLIGPDETAREKTALNDAVLRGARARDVEMNLQLTEKLDQAILARRELFKLRKAEDTDTPGIYPDDLSNALFAHQRVSLAYIGSRPGFLLADQPGVGKTAPAIMWAAARATDSRLVVVPGSARWQWAREIDRWDWTGLPVNIVDGKIPEQKEIISHSPGWVITHWESLVHARDAIVSRDWKSVILDEVHLIRNREIKRTETAHQLAGVPNRLALSGHPFFKSPEELWSILHFLYPHEYSSFWRFYSMHVEWVPKGIFGGRTVLGARQPKLLQWEMAPFMLRRKKNQVYKSLPPVARIPRYVELPTKQRKEYKKLCKELFVELQGREKSLTIVSSLARTTRQRQYLVDPGLLGANHKSVKYQEALEIMEELDGPPVIFTAFRQAAERLAAFLSKQGKTTAVISGLKGKKKAAKLRRKAEKDFHAGELDALIVVMAAGGTSLNYGRYGYIILLDLPWTAADLEQLEGRVDRPVEGTGEIVPTTAFRIIARDTYEEKLEKKLEKRHKMFGEVFEPGEIISLFKE